MNDRSLILYRDSPERLREIDYCDEVQDFINYALSNSRNISGGNIRYPCMRCKNKIFSQSRCCNSASFTKMVHGKIHVLVCTRRTICFSRDHDRKEYGWVNF
jgi:hypothetical protein